MNALVLNHLHYSLIKLNSITQNLLPQQQLNWAKNRASPDITSTHRAISTFNIVIYQSDTFWTSNSFVISEGCHKIHSLLSKQCHSLLSLYLKIKARKLDCQVRHRPSILGNRLMKRVCTLWITTHPDSTSSKYTNNTVKVKFKEYFHELFLQDRDAKVYGKLR